jgi:hypothetical protein
VGTTVVLWLGREVKGVSRRARGLRRGSLLGAPCVFPGVVQMAQSGGLRVGWVFPEGLECQSRERGEEVLLQGSLHGGNGEAFQGRSV